MHWLAIMKAMMSEMQPNEKLAMGERSGSCGKNETATLYR